MATQHELIGCHPSIEHVRYLVSRYAPRSEPVLITGETGVGKELVARLVHAASRRRDKPLVPVNCGSLRPELAAAQIFGHRRGAFTGAVADAPGYAAEAHGGTLFLDELGDLCADGQKALLRLVQEGQLQPIGATRSVAVDVRVVSATHRDLERGDGPVAFRSDLFYRLGVLRIEIPPLRERASDIPAIATHLLQSILPGATLTPEAREWLMDQPWRGNVRELQALLTRAASLTDDGLLSDRRLAESRHASSMPGRGRPRWTPRDGTRIRQAWELARRDPRVSNADIARHLDIARTTWLGTLRRCKVTMEEIAGLAHPPA